MPISLPEQTRRAEKFKAANKVLRRRVTALEREIRATRKTAFKAGSALAFESCYRAIGSELSDALAISRGRKSVLDPVIQEAITALTDDLLRAVGLRRQR